MLIQIMLAALAAANPSVAFAQASPPVAPAAQGELVRVALDTYAGRILLELDQGRAPVTVANFLHYVDSGKLDGEAFYRSMKYGDGGLVQGGITSDAGKLKGPIAHEPTSRTGLKHVAGTISMAAAAPGSAQSDFFIITTDIPAFDADANGQGFAAFGRVVEGMDVVRTILAAPTSPTKGEGVMKGQMLEPVVRIAKAKRVGGGAAGAE